MLRHRVEGDGVTKDRVVQVLGDCVWVRTPPGLVDAEGG
jgi:hypothetical protein